MTNTYPKWRIQSRKEGEKTTHTHRADKQNTKKCKSYDKMRIISIVVVVHCHLMRNKSRSSFCHPSGNVLKWNDNILIWLGIMWNDNGFNWMAADGSVATAFVISSCEWSWTCAPVREREILNALIEIERDFKAFAVSKRSWIASPKLIGENERKRAKNSHFKHTHFHIFIYIYIYIYSKDISLQSTEISLILFSFNDHDSQLIKWFQHCQRIPYNSLVRRSPLRVHSANFNIVL